MISRVFFFFLPLPMLPPDYLPSLAPDIWSYVVAWRRLAVPSYASAPGRKVYHSLEMSTHSDRTRGASI